MNIEDIKNVEVRKFHFCISYFVELKDGSFLTVPDDKDNKDYITVVKYLDKNN